MKRLRAGQDSGFGPQLAVLNTAKPPPNPAHKKAPRFRGAMVCVSCAEDGGEECDSRDQKVKRVFTRMPVLFSTVLWVFCC